MNPREEAITLINQAVENLQAKLLRDIKNAVHHKETAATRARLLNQLDTLSAVQTQLTQLIEK